MDAAGMVEAAVPEAAEDDPDEVTADDAFFAVQEVRRDSVKRVMKIVAVNLFFRVGFVFFTVIFPSYSFSMYVKSVFYIHYENVREKFP